MSDAKNADLEERVARLERLVDALRSSPPKAEPQPSPHPGRPEVSPRPRKRRGGSRPWASLEGEGLGAEWRKRFSLAGQSEQWLGRIGIGFVVLALAFLLKLSFDRGWVTPELRLGAGLVTGISLLILGIRLDPAKRALGQALLGGSVAVFYLTGFAGFELYELVPFWVAFALMTATTVLSIGLSMRQDSPLLAVLGVSGGLATPFLLDTGSGDVNALAIYASLVLIGGGVVQYLRGWRSLLGVLLLGGTTVLSLVVTGAGAPGDLVPALAIAVFWLVGSASPILRPVRGVGPSPEEPRDFALWSNRIALAWGTAIAVILFSVLFELDTERVGWLLLFFGALTGSGAFLTRGVRLSQWPSAEVSALCVALGWIWVTGESVAFLLILLEAGALFVLVWRGAPSSLATLGHLLAATVAVGFLFYAANAQTGEVLGLREEALVRLAMLGLLVPISFRVAKDQASFYRGGAYVGLLIWFLSEFGPLEYGAQMVSIAWSVQGAVALIMSLRKDSQTLQIAGLGTLGLVAGKLLLFDLSQLDPGWRILMFFGFGVSLLALAYLVNRPKAEGDDS